jgi:hypothetical protein
LGLIGFGFHGGDGGSVLATNKTLLIILFLVAYSALMIGIEVSPRASSNIL